MAKKGTLRVAYLRIAQETNALSPVRTTIDDFRRTQLVEGSELASRMGRFGNEAPGFTRNAELSGFVQTAHKMDKNIELVPIFSAWTVPSGPLSRECYDDLQDRLETGLHKAGPLDGVFISMHGAMGVEGVRDPETEFLRTAAQASSGAALGVSYDLHANLTKERVESALISCAYHTNPHRDHASTGARVARNLIPALRGETNPVTAWRSLPMLLGGGMTIDFLNPMRPLFKRLKTMAKEGALDASLLMCHPWNNDPELGWSTLAITDNDVALAERFADELAELCWSVKDIPPPEFLSPQEAIEEARTAKLARKVGVVAICETSDIVSAGATGDSMYMVSALLEQGSDLTSYAALRDPAAIDTLWQHADGDTVTLSLGATIDPTQGPAHTLTGRIMLRRPDGPFGRIVVFDLGPVKLVITEGLPLMAKPAFFRELGLRLRDADIVVIKNLFPFRLFYLPWARKTLNVKTKGLTDLDAAHALEFADPVHPKDVVHDWRPTDQRRRGL